MSKKVWSILLILILFAVSASAATDWTCLYDGKINTMAFCSVCGRSKEDATSWECPTCKQINKNNAKFCTNCGYSRIDSIESASSSNEHIVELASVTSKAGTTTISWLDNEKSAPYQVSYSYEGENQQDHILNEVKVPQCSVNHLIPGKNYIFTITDAQKRSTHLLVQVPETPSFEDGKLLANMITFDIFQKYNRDQKWLPTRFASDVDMDSLKNYGIQIKVNYPKLVSPATYEAMIAIYSPDGFVDSLSIPNFQLSKGQEKRLTKWTDVIGTDFFASLFSCRGQIAAGNYKVELYFNGMYVAYASFSIK